MREFKIAPARWRLDSMFALVMGLLASSAMASPRSESLDPGNAVRTPEASLPTEAALQISLEELTNTYDRVRNAREGILGAPARMTRDSHGRTLADDVRQNVLVSGVRERVAFLLRTAEDSLANHDLAATSESLAEASAILRREEDMYSAISAYWEWHAVPKPNRDPYIRHLLINGLPVAYAREIETTEQTFEQQIEASLFVDAMNTTLPMLRQLHEKAAADQAAEVRRVLNRREFAPFKTREGNAKCARSSSRTSGSSQPSMVSSAPIADYYPAISRDLREEGLVLVDVLVARNGCPARAWITASSGYERLDDAALSYALRARYRPAQIRGRIVAVRLPLTLKFESTHD
jgi:TonB family protein